MRTLRVWCRRVAGLFQSGRRDRELAAELDSHFQLHIDDNLRAGMSPDEARRLARVKFGPVEAIKEQVRDRTSIPAGDALWRDVRDALRNARWRPGFTLLAVLTLAIGVGANAAMFGLVDDLMLRPPDGVRDPDRVVALHGVSTYVRYQELGPLLETLAIAAFTRHSLSFGRGSEAIEIRAECVTPTFFPVLGATPALGRAFVPGEDALGQPRTAVLSHGFWRRQFGAATDAVGRTVTIAGRSHTVVGVAPPGFNGVQLGAVDVWILLAATPEACSFSGSNLLRSEGGSWLRTIGRLRDDATVGRAAADLSAAHDETRPPDTGGLRRRSDPRPRLEPIATARTDGSSGTWRQTRLAVWLAGGAAMLLLIACANVAGLLSTRALDRRGEIALRLQLGATRRRLFHQLLIENLVLAALCCGIAVFFAIWIGMALRAFLPIGGDEWLDARSAAVLIAFAAIAGSLSGVVPALQASRADLVGHFRSGLAVRQTRIVFRHVMLVVQVALALVLVVVSGLFVRSVQNFRADFAYDRDDIVVVSLDFKKAGVHNGAAIGAASQRMLERLRQLPEVTSVAARSGTFIGVGSHSMVTAVRRSADDRSGCCHALVAVSPEYFGAVGLRFVQGRTFTEQEAVRGNAIVLNEQLARDLFPDGQAVGRCVLVPNGPCREIVGVVETSRRGPLRSSQVDSEFFLPFREQGEAVPQILLVRPATSGDALATIAAAVRGVSQDLPFITIERLGDLIDVQARSWRMGATIFGLFGTLAVVLAGIGVYASAAFSVRERTGEIGVRIALGAQRRDILLLVVRYGALVLAVGSVLGAVAAWSVGGALQSVLLSVAPTDARTFAAAAAILAAACMAGCLVPAWRAARVDPAVALRHH